MVMGKPHTSYHCTDSAHPPQRLRRQRPSSRNSRSQGASGSTHDYHPSAHQRPQHGPLYQSSSGLPFWTASLRGLCLPAAFDPDQGFPAASSLFHSPEASSSPGLGPPGLRASPQPTRSTAISCIGLPGSNKLCNTNVSTYLRPGDWPWKQLLLIFLLVGSTHGERTARHGFLDHVNAPSHSFSCVLHTFLRLL